MNRKATEVLTDEINETIKERAGMTTDELQTFGSADFHIERAMRGLVTDLINKGRIAVVKSTAQTGCDFGSFEPPTNDVVSEVSRNTDEEYLLRNTRHLVIGHGQIGRALCEVLHEHYSTVEVLDLTIKPTLKKFDVIHVCIPYTPTFHKDVIAYVKKYAAKFHVLIVHSTVPMGTCKELGAVHSPVRGVHPNLALGIKTFLKFFGGAGSKEAAHYFDIMGISTWSTPIAENTEALKLWDTTYYGWNIIFEKAVHKFCADNLLDFELIYHRANNSYNTGYEKLGRDDVQRPVLNHRDGPIGGHCVIPNARLLGARVAGILLAEDFELQFDKHIKDATGKPWPKKTNNGQTHFVGDTCPGGHKERTHCECACLKCESDSFLKHCFGKKCITKPSEGTLRKLNKGYCGKCGDSKPECKCPKKKTPSVVGGTRTQD